MREQLTFMTKAGVKIHLTPAPVLMQTVRANLYSQFMERAEELGPIPTAPPDTVIEEEGKEPVTISGKEDPQYKTLLDLYSAKFQNLMNQLDAQTHKIRVTTCVVEDPPPEWVEAHRPMLEIMKADDQLTKEMWVDWLCVDDEGFKEMMVVLGESTEPTQEAIDEAKAKHEPKSGGDSAEPVSVPENGAAPTD